MLPAIFPANVQMTTSGVVLTMTAGGGDPSAAVRWGRLPLQTLLLTWAYWYPESSAR